MWLCDEAWAQSSQGDPAYQPAQMALTSGFVCIAVCDCASGSAPDNHTMHAFASQPQETRDRVCAALPSDPFDADYFAAASSPKQLGWLAAKLLREPCQCGHP